MKRRAFQSLAALALAITATTLCSPLLFARVPQTFTGTIHDNKCVGPACATMCPIDKDPVYTLQTPDHAWVLSDPKLASQLAAKFAGQKVTIKGTVRGNRLLVQSVTPSSNRAAN